MCLFVFICIFGPLKIVFNKKAYWVRYIFVLHTNWIFVHTDRSAKLYLMRIFLKPLNSHDCLVYVSNPPRMCCKCMFYLGISNHLIDIPITDVLQNRILRSRIKVVQSGHCLPAAGPGTPTIAGYLISARAVPGTLCRQYLCPSCHITAPSLADKMVTYKNSFIINVPS